VILLQSLKPSNRWLLLIILGFSVLLGAFEGVYGRLRYSGDAISYLNVVRAIHSGDWRLALSAYWGLGYPLILSAATVPYSNSPEYEWVAVHCVNLCIFAVAFLCFHGLAWTMARFTPFAISLENVKGQRFFLLAVSALFLSIELSMDNVSRVGPDILVSCLVFVASRLLIRLIEEPNSRDAVALGGILGVGYVVKAIFLPLALIFGAVELIALLARPTWKRCVLLTAASWLIFAIPYVAGISWAAGGLTFGEAGPLNYAWNVNGLPAGGLWQGLPPELGKPIHPVELVSQHPSVFLFGGKFPVSFPPFFNLPYYYQGYHHVFNWKLQLRAVGKNILRILRALSYQGILYALILCCLLRLSTPKSRKNLLRDYARMWPLFTIAIAGMSLYALVVVEARYIASFIAILGLLCVLAISNDFAAVRSTGRSNAMILSIIMVGFAGSFLVNQKDTDRDVFGHALRGEIFSNYDQWEAALYLRRIGFRAGDQVAIMADVLNSTRCTWAYVDHLNIIGQLGASPAEFDEFWYSTPATQRQILEIFHRAGARMICEFSATMRE
jgi:hypothetical protein